MQILTIPGLDPFYNLALEEFLLRGRYEYDPDDYLLLWRNHNTIVVGRNQNTAEEINAEFVRENGVSVVRRITGGGAVYHDRNNVNFSFITRVNDVERLTMERFTAPMVQALRQMGAHAEVSGRNDIVVDGRKVSGNAQSLYRERILHHGTLLFDADLSVLSSALKVNPLKFKSKSSKSVRSRVGNLKDFLPDVGGVEDFMRRLEDILTRNTEARPLELTARELGEIEKLKETKYATWEWNVGESPAFSFRNLEKFDGGIVDARLNVNGGHIQDAVFYGDFMAVRDLDPVTAALKGRRYVREDVALALGALPLNEYFGSISLEELLDCLFGGDGR